MCITFAASNVAGGRFPIVVALNRDENPERQTAPLSEWEYEQQDGASCQIIGGQDLESKGTWFGFSKEHQRFAVLTNRRRRSDLSQAAWEERRCRMEQQDTNQQQKKPRHSYDGLKLSIGVNYKSRGLLVCDVLKDGYEFSKNQKGSFYRPFNLLLGSTKDGLVHVSEDNLDHNGFKLTGESVYAMTNADDVNPPWPKAVRGKKLFEEVLDGISAEDTAETVADKLFQVVLLDSKQFALSEQSEDERAQGDDVAQLTGPIFLPKNEVWHTLSSTVLIVDANQVATIVEWSHPLCRDGKDAPTKTQVKCDKLVSRE
ncbi:unnamed protein product [Cylindrotheca closterium]|uniref:DUF833-domain-containing protein n=1 Tax=Cylindrotheca closterium TaxID=2856 RepID=A0AAD2FF39_9STRA|nr:unnamed protein product [Cylindrotheca closterium]